MKTPIVSGLDIKYPSDVVTLVIGKRLFFKYAQYSIEYIYDTEPTAQLLLDLRRRGVDLLIFAQRNFLENGRNHSYHKETEVIGLLKINSFDNWWKHQIGKKVRAKIRGAARKGTIVKLVEVDDDFVRSAWDIYNETPTRQGLQYSGYGLSLAAVREKFKNLESSEILGAFSDGKLIGFMWIVYGDTVASIESFVSFIKSRRKNPNNALMAEAVRRCAEKGFTFLWYARMGYLQGLDSFRAHHGFVGFPNAKYFVPLSSKGLLAIKLRLHMGLEYALSPRMTQNIMPLYRFVNRIFPVSILKKMMA